MVVMPSDHVIVDSQSFRDAVTAGEKLIDEDPTRIVTFGIRPDVPCRILWLHRSCQADLGCQADRLPSRSVSRKARARDRGAVSLQPATSTGTVASFCGAPRRFWMRFRNSSRKCMLT